MIVGWQQFVRGRDATGRPTPRLVVVGDGPQKAMVDELVDGDQTITCTGWVLGPEVPKHLAQADLGLAPTRPGQGTTISNKVAEYMAGGLFVLNTLTEPVAAELDASSLGARVESTPVAWSEGFETAERNLESLRSSRPGRIETATVRFGRDRAEELWFGLIDEVLAGRATGPAIQRQASTA
jgi:glycosyltransferase involved in cell wall biosynthesis